MKKLLLPLFVLFFLASCEQVVFPEAQPKKTRTLENIPTELQGTYLDQDMDTLIVNLNSFTYESEAMNGLKDVVLSDSAVLKEYRDRYYFSSRIRIGQEHFWLTYILHLREQGNFLDVYTMDPGDVVRLAKLQEITSKVDDIEDGETEYYLFDPKKRDYKKIVRDTVFTKIIVFERIR